MLQTKEIETLFRTYYRPLCLYALHYLGDPDAVEDAKETGATIQLVNDPYEAAKEADIVVTDTWASMGQEEEHDARKKIFAPYQVNKELMAHADKRAIVMHCLPSHRGQEITDEVQDGPHSRVFPEAHNRLHAQKGVLACLLTLRRGSRSSTTPALGPACRCSASCVTTSWSTSASTERPSACGSH